MRYLVVGMSCAACAARIEKAVSKVDGVTKCAVSLLTNSMVVEGGASAASVVGAVRDAGYDAVPEGESGGSSGNLTGASDDGPPRAASARDTRDDGDETRQDAAYEGPAGTEFLEEQLKDRETPILKRRLIFSLIFLAALLYISMGHMMWGWPLPPFFEGNHVAVGILQMILAAVIMLINGKFFVSGFKGLIHRAPNMDTLVALGSAAAFIYSTVMLFAMTGAMARGDEAAVSSYMNELYFESAATILAFITVGKMLEAKSKGRATDALKGLMKLAPKTAVIVKDGNEVSVPIQDVRKGDIFVVRPGESIPVDGIVTDGESAVDESMMTGESIPADKAAGSQVYAGTMNKSGFIRCEASRVGRDTTLSQIIQMVGDASATKAPIARVADKVSGIFVPAVMAIAAVTVIVWLIIGRGVGFALARGISVLVISCPCALGLATPVAIMVGNGVGSRNGILFKTAEALEETGRTKTVALDKTGTITEGQPEVTDIIPAPGRDERELMALAYALEIKSEHPLSLAITRKADEMRLDAGEYEITGFRALSGNGLTADLGGRELIGGNERFVTEKIRTKSPDPALKDMRARAAGLSREGKTPLYFALGGELIGVIAVADTIKPDGAEAIARLRAMGLRVVMLTGDNETTAKAIAKKAGLSEVIAGVIPGGKERAINDLKENGKVMMVGDGINDAPALTAADVGVAVGVGADIAVDAADVVLMNNNLTDVPAAIRLGRAVLRNIHENLFWAFFYNAIGIPLAAGVFISSLGWQLSPMFAAAAMSLSSFCVVANALRLNFLNIHKKRKMKTEKNEKDKMAGIAGIDEKRGTSGITGTDVKRETAGITGTDEKKETADITGTDARSETADITGTDEKKETAGMAGEDEKRKSAGKENGMTKTLTIEGMMCANCERHVKNALEAIDGVKKAVVSHESGTAVVKLTKEAADEALINAVTDEGYKVIKVE